MADSKYDVLKLKNQMCFPLYAASREVIKQYKPYLDRIDLTYTQYIAMMLLWENKSMTVKAMGECLHLDSGTLTPLLKKLESKGFLTRTRSLHDERNLIITITESGENLKEQAVHIPEKMTHCVSLEPQEAAELYRILYKLLGKS